MSEAGRSLREWRRRRQLTQLELAHQVGVSTRHLSFVETGRSRPSSALVLRLCDHLSVPLREQNRVLVTAGHAPAHPEHALTAVPMRQVSEAIEAILTGHLPFPALVVDRGWELVSANDALYPLVEGVASHLLEPPVNVIRLSLHPGGLAPRIVNLDEWRDHLLHRVRSETRVSADARLEGILTEFGSTGDPHDRSRDGSTPRLIVPLLLRLGTHVLSLISTTTVFGTPREVTLSELAIEAFHPADEQTRALLVDRSVAAGPPEAP